MATVYSLVCFGGAAGLACTANATTNRITITTAGPVPNTGLAVQFTASTLPDGISASTPYYARYYDADEFSLYDTYAHAIDTGSTDGLVDIGPGTGTTVVVWGDYYLGLTATQKLRYGAVGSEKIYSGFKAWYDARVSAGWGEWDTEYCEIADGFIDRNSAMVTVAPTCLETIIHTKIDGVRSSAFHNGAMASSYVMRAIGYDYIIKISSMRVTVDGVDFEEISDQSSGAIKCDAKLSTIRNCIFRATSFYSSVGIRFNASYTSYGCDISNNIFYKCGNSSGGTVGAGISLGQYTNALSRIYNNLCVECGDGFFCNGVATEGVYYNNLAINSLHLNWGATEPTFDMRATFNYGESGDAIWTDAGGVSSDELTDADFTDYAGLDFSPTLDSIILFGGTTVPDGIAEDMLGKPRPAYIDVTHRFDYDNEADGPFTVGERLSWGSEGTAGTGVLLELTDDGTTGTMAIHLTSGAEPADDTEITGDESEATCDINGTPEEPTGEWVPAPHWSAGPIEYDFGGPLALVTLTLQNVVDGSIYQIYNVDTSTVIATGTQSGTADIVISNIAYTGSSDQLRIRVRKASASPLYKCFTTYATMNGGDLSAYISQVLDE